MKRIIFLLLMCYGIAQAQTTGFLRYDTVVLQKVGGNSELKILNATRSITGGLFTNVGNGLGRYIRPTVSSDTLFIGTDTLIVDGQGGNLQETTDLGNYATNKILSSAGFGSRDTLQYVDFWATTSKYMGGFQDRQFTSNAPYTNDTSTQIGFSHYGPLAGYANRYQTTPTSITAIGSDACRDCLLSGNVAFGNAALKRADSAFRNAAGGNGTLQFTRYGDENTTWGTFALEVQTVASGNVAIGSNAGRGNKLGTGMTVVGAYALVSNTTGVDSVQITNSGHGCSGTPTVTFSAPVTYNKDGSTINGTPGAAVATATGTAVMDGSGNVVRVTMTNQGAGYTTQLAPGVLNTATFSGGGCSVTPTATVVLISGDYNTGMGNNTLRGNTLGKYNTAIGYGAAYAGASGEAGNIDNYGLWIGYHASRHSTISATTRLSHASAIGANAKVRGDSMMIFGDSAAALRFGYGTTYVDRSAIAEFKTTTRGILLPKLTTTQMNAVVSPATGLVIYNTDSTAAGGLMHYTGSAWAKVGGSSGGGTGTVTSVAAGYGMNFTTITTTGSVIADSSVLMTKGTTQVVSGGKLYSANQIFNAQHATNRITIGSVSGQEQYPGIWMTSAAISLTNYAFLADISAGINYVNGMNGSGLRVNNADAFRVTSTGAGFGNVTSPTSRVEIQAGTSSVDVLEYNSGTLNSTINAGRVNYNGNIYASNVALNRFGLGGAIKDFIADSANTGTSEEFLYRYTTKASTLTNDGDKIMCEYAINLTDATANKEVKIYFAGTEIYTTGSMIGIETEGKINVTIIRTSSSTARAIVSGNLNGYLSLQTDLTSLTFSNTYAITPSVTVSGASGGAGDATFKMGTVFFWPAANN